MTSKVDVGMHLAAPSQAVAAVADSVHQVLLAGLGAVVVTERGLVQLFDRLVREGRTLEQEAGHAVQSGFEWTKGTVAALGRNAAGQWNRVERTVSEGVGYVRHGFGLPTSEELEQLNQRIEALDARIAELTEAGARGDRGQGTQN